MCVHKRLKKMLSLHHFARDWPEASNLGFCSGIMSRFFGGEIFGRPMLSQLTMQDSWRLDITSPLPQKKIGVPFGEVH